MDGASRLACLGMGKALYAQGQTDSALRYLKASQDKKRSIPRCSRASAWRLCGGILRGCSRAQCLLGLRSGF